MKNTNKKYFTWTLLVGFFCNAMIDARSNYSYGYGGSSSNYSSYGNSGYTPYNSSSSNSPSPVPLFALIAICAIYALLEYSSEEKQTAEKDDNQPVLSYDERVRILKIALQNLNATSLNVSIIAAQTENYSKQKLLRFISLLQKTSYDHSDIFTQLYISMPFCRYSPPITMSHVRWTLDEIHSGQRIHYIETTVEVFNTAVHEAGHALAIIKSKGFILYHSSILNRKKYSGSNLLIWPETTTFDDYKNGIIIFLAGGVAEQTFGFDSSWNLQCGTKKHDKDIDWRALSKNKNISEGLAELFLWHSTSHDMKTVYNFAAYLVECQICDKNSPDFQDQVCKIIEECYQSTVELIQSHKKQVEKIANILIDRKIVSGYELYEAIRVKHPVYEFKTTND